MTHAFMPTQPGRDFWWNVSRIHKKLQLRQNLLLTGKLLTQHIKLFIKSKTHLNAVIVTVDLMAIVGKVPQAFIVHRENPRHSQNEHLFPVPSLLKNPLAKNSYLHPPVCFIFRWRQLRKVRMGRAVWGSNVVGLKVQQLHSARQPRCPRTQVVVLDAG